MTAALYVTMMESTGGAGCQSSSSAVLELACRAAAGKRAGGQQGGKGTERRVCVLVDCSLCCAEGAAGRESGVGEIAVVNGHGTDLGKKQQRHHRPYAPAHAGLALHGPTGR